MNQYGILTREPSFEYLGKHFNLIIHFWFDPGGLGTEDRAPTHSFHFSLNFSLHFLSMGLQGCGIEPPQPYLLLVSNSFSFSPLAEGVWVPPPTAPLQFLLLNFPWFCLVVVGSIRMRFILYFSFNFLMLTERWWVRI